MVDIKAPSVHYLIIAQGSANETEHWLQTARDCELGLNEKIGEALRLNTEVVRMITTTIHTIRAKKNRSPKKWLTTQLILKGQIVTSNLYPLSPIPSFDFGNSGPPLHFLHANGYPPECYRPFLELLQTHYHVFGMLLRPLWGTSNPDELQDWHPFSDDLLQFLASQPSPVIGVGHSIGAIVTLRAALRDPSRFQALILLDPVLLVPSRLVAWNLVRAIGLGNKVHPKIAGALKRRRTFDDLDLVFQGYRNREVFRYMSDENLRIYIEGITRKTEQGYELVYSPEWESRVYLTSQRDFDIWRGLPNLDVPTLFVRGAETDTFLESAARLVKRLQPKARVETLPKSTHLLPARPSPPTRGRACGWRTTSARRRPSSCRRSGSCAA